jgi:hypothetical protein
MDTMKAQINAHVNSFFYLVCIYPCSICASAMFCIECSIEDTNLILDVRTGICKCRDGYYLPDQNYND